MKRNKILVECYNDETLILTYKISKYDIEHNINGKSEVLEKIEKRTNCLAVIDNDKGTEHPYFECAELLEVLADDMKVFIEKEKNNYFIVFYPRLENVIEGIVKEDDRNIETAGKLELKTDRNSLHNIGSDDIKLTKIKQLFDVLISRNDKLQQIRKYL